MKVRCLHASGSELPSEYRKRGYKHTLFNNLTIGEEYYVYGICSFDSMVGYLIIEDNSGYPTWKPAPLFEVIDNMIPRNWKYEYFGEYGHHVEFIMSYKELVENKSHYEGLSELSPKHLKVFDKESRKTY